MSNSENKSKHNIPLLIIDNIGNLIMAFGLLEYFDYITIVPEKWRIENYAVYIIVFGFLLTIPYLFDILKKKYGKQPKEI